MSLLLEQTDKNPVFHSIRTLVQKTASSNDNVLITGPKRSEKDGLAKTIHKNSKRSTGPFISVSTQMFSVPGFKQKLFGPGGMVEKSDGGTLYFEDFDLLPLDFQSELLQILEGRRMPIWQEGKLRSLDVRVIGASKMNLKEAVQNQRFNPKLYERVAQLPVLLPSENTYFFIPQSSSLPTLEEVELQYIQYVMRMVRGNKAKASRILGINRRTLYRKAPSFEVFQ